MEVDWFTGVCLICFFFSDYSFFKYLDVFSASCYDYWIAFKAFLLLFWIDVADWLTWFYLFFVEPDRFKAVGDLRLFMDGVLLNDKLGS